MVLANPANVHVQSKQHMHVQNNPANVHVQNKQHMHVQSKQYMHVQNKQHVHVQNVQTCMCRTSNMCTDGGCTLQKQSCSASADD